MLDLEEAMEEADEPNLTWQELFRLLGVPTTENGVPVNMSDAANACLHTLSNPAVQNLSHKERIRALRSAAATLSILMGC